MGPPLGPVSRAYALVTRRGRGGLVPVTLAVCACALCRSHLVVSVGLQCVYNAFSLARATAGDHTVHFVRVLQQRFAPLLPVRARQHAPRASGYSVATRYHARRFFVMGRRRPFLRSGEPPRGCANRRGGATFGPPLGPCLARVRAGHPQREGRIGSCDFGGVRVCAVSFTSCGFCWFTMCLQCFFIGARNGRRPHCAFCARFATTVCSPPTGPCTPARATSLWVFRRNEVPRSPFLRHGNPLGTWSQQLACPRIALVVAFGECAIREGGATSVAPLCMSSCRTTGGWVL